MRFAKLFDLENEEQVLITIDYNNDDDTYEVKIRTFFDGCTPIITLSFDDEDKAMIAMNKYQKDNAVDFIKDMKSQFM